MYEQFKALQPFIIKEANKELRSDYKAEILDIRKVQFMQKRNNVQWR